MRLARAWWSEEDHVGAFGDEVQPGQVVDQVAEYRPLVGEVEVLDLLMLGKRAARMRASPPWAWREATSRCRHAARNSSWVQSSPRS